LIEVGTKLQSLGKVILEKIIYSIPDVSSVTLLIRPKVN